jgi:lipopolysaccharide/colanic/teichoic acid biosynthesis glycosyltransferase
MVASTHGVDNLPLWPIIALAVRLGSRGPALFHQEQWTKDGRILRMFKFLTMLTGDRVCDTTVPFFKLVSDTRLSRVGAFLRRLSVEELSKLWNSSTGGVRSGPTEMCWPSDWVSG